MLTDITDQNVLIGALYVALWTDTVYKSVLPDFLKACEGTGTGKQGYLLRLSRMRIQKAIYLYKGIS